MPSYIILGKYTDQGIRNVKQSPQRLDAARGAVEKAGGTMQFYLTMGRYDFVALTEAPDDETFAKVLLGIGASGNISTETLKAFPEAEFRRITAGLP
jgi:uncharacterized protein with GYD domain